MSKKSHEWVTHVEKSVQMKEGGARTIPTQISSLKGHSSIVFWAREWHRLFVKKSRYPLFWGVKLRSDPLISDITRLNKGFPKC